MSSSSSSDDDVFGVGGCSVDECTEYVYEDIASEYRCAFPDEQMSM